MRVSRYHTAVSCNVSARTGTFTAAAALLLALGAAPAAADAVRVQFSTKVPVGQQPRVTVIVQEPLDSVSVELHDDDGRDVTARFGALGRGATREVALPAAPGRRHYAGRIVISQGGRTRDSELSFDAVVTPRLEIQIDKARVDVAGRKLEARLSRPASKATVQVFGPSGGDPVAEAEHDFGGEAAGQPLTVTWPEPSGGSEVARIDLKLYDVDGFYAGVSLFPWSVTIPHEEVNFATDSATIGPSEQPKLEASFGLIADGLASTAASAPSSSTSPATPTRSAPPATTSSSPSAGPSPSPAGSASAACACPSSTRASASRPRW
jgi:hypothetical protein